VPIHRSMSAPLRDHDLRQAAYRRLLAHAGRRPETRIINELGLMHGAARVDIAVIDGHIRAVEIKAEADTLDRLPRQVEAYGQVVDKATLIAAERHVGPAIPLIPEWWGVIVGTRSSAGRVSFRRIRSDRINRSTDPRIVVKLMWRSEAAEALRALGCTDRILRAPRAVLYEELVARMPRGRLAALVRITLMNRENWRDRPPLS
jgi:hypothetical protein